MNPTPTQRVHYADGMLVQAEDLTTDQSYHGRARRALAYYLHGPGVLRGLDVTVDRHGHPGEADGEPRTRVVVSAGQAIDAAGRLVEVYQPMCMNLEKWLGDLDRDAVPDVAEPTVSAALALRYRRYSAGRRPAFVSGLFDATDATREAHDYDGFDLDLLRPEQATSVLIKKEPLAGADFEARLASLEAELRAWLPAAGEGPDPQEEDGEDPEAGDWVLLAELTIPVAVSAESVVTYRDGGASVSVDHSKRRSVLTATDLYRALTGR